MPAWLFLTGSSAFKCSSSGSVFIRDDGVFNKAPVAFDDEFLVTVNEPLMGFMRATDDNDDELLFSIVQTPTLGVVTVEDVATGTFTYIASAEGEDSFSFVANDGQANSNTATITIVVGAGTLALSEHDMDKTATPCDAPTAEVAVDPFDPSHWLRGSGSIVMSSVDAGQSWQHVSVVRHPSRPDHARVSFNSDVPGLVYLSLYWKHEASSIYRSDDGGQTWKLIARLKGNLTALRSTLATPPEVVILTLEVCGRSGDLIAIDRPWR